MKLLTNFRLPNETSATDSVALQIEGDKIAQLLPIEQVESTEDAEVIDLQGNLLCPGYIDVQLNGCGGIMFNDQPTLESLRIMHRTNIRFGCTSFLPTLITSSDQTVKDAIEATRLGMKEMPGSVLGLHLEGPWLNIQRKGIHDADFVRQPSTDLLKLICANSDVVRKVTLAPEVAGTDTIQKLTDAGVVVSLGHTMATSQQAKSGFDAGARFVTHLFNAMPPLTGREPGILGQALLENDVYCGVIADGYHVDFANIQLVHRLIGERLVLVTDATAAAGADIDSFIFVNTTVLVKDGKCVDENGTLGGSALTMDEAVKRAHKGAKLPAQTAIQLATRSPAKAIGMEDTIGSISANRLANFVVLDEDLNVSQTWVNGQKVFG